MYNIIVERGKTFNNSRRKGMIKDMGMTDKQFNLFLRFLQRALLEAKKENNLEEKNQKIDEILEDMQKAIDD